MERIVQIGRDRGWVVEDPLSFHRAFPQLPVPGEAFGVLRRQDGMRLLCCLERSMNDVELPEEGRARPRRAGGGERGRAAAPGVSDSPDGVDGVLADSHRYAVRDGIKCVWTKRDAWQASGERSTSSPPRRPPSSRDRRLRSAGLRGGPARVRRNFSERRELGAAVAAYVGGEKVVDLWGRPSWQRDTLVLVYSTSKGLSAMTLALLHSRGLLDYDERVSTYWPEFARRARAGHCCAGSWHTGRAARDRQATRCRAAGRLRPARRRHRGPAAALDAR